jgi:DNA repair ATPase RecN
MTNQELNRDIKRLAKLAANYTKANENVPETRKQITDEVKRLFNADNSFENMNKESVLTLLRLNLRYVVIPLHNFGIHINR